METPEELRTSTSMAVEKGSTLKDDPSSSIAEWTQSVALSESSSLEATAVISTSDERKRDGEIQDELNQVTLSSNPPVESTLSKTKLPFFTPVIYTILLLHIIYHIQYHLVSYGDTLSQTLLSNPLPPPFKDSITRWTLRLPLSKRLDRLRWRLKLVQKKCGGILFQQALPWVLILPIFINAASDIVSGEGREGWNAVVGREGGFRPFDLRWYANPAVKGSAKWFKPLRDFVLLEVSPS